MNEIRINDGCRQYKYDHDGDIIKFGYCRQCGKTMTIKQLIKLYKG